MASRHRKLVVRAEPSCVSLGVLLEPIVLILPGLQYFAITFHGGSVCFNMQNAERVSHANVARLTQLFEKHVDIAHISSYSTVEGELLEEWRSKRKRGISTGSAAQHTNTVFVNPLGEESLQHVTRDYVVDLLKQTLNIGVFFKFGLKLYSLSQNVNFRTRKYREDVRVRTKNKWITVSKDKAYDQILLMLVDKTREAVEKYKAGIPAFYLDHFNMFLPVVLENRDSTVPWRKKMHDKNRNKGLDTIAESVNDRLGGLSKWRGKKIKLL